MPVTAKDAAITRKAAMEGLQERVQSKAGGGKLKGKVGIITGVGPSTGIGVSTHHWSITPILTLDRHGEDHGP